MQSVSQLREEIRRVQATDINYSEKFGAGETITIAVVDSILDVSFLDDSELTTGKQQNYIASDDPFTTPHGANVLGAISWYAPDAIYDLHRIVIDSGDIKPSNCLKAMAEIRDGSVDIANISAGVHHADCQQQCRMCQAAQEVADSGTIIVAGAGNDLHGQEKTMYCPALSDHTISVGSFEAVCTCSVSNSRSRYRQTPEIFPPGAYWIRETANEHPGEPVNQTFCSRRNCAPGHTCDTYRKERISDQSVDFRLGEPDVFAPDHLAYERPTGAAGIERGSSYATAIVSGALGGILSKLSEERVLPTPDEINHALNRLNETVGNTPYRRFDSESLYHELV
ncbi:S8 family serine peptidase [Haloarcula amylolytica]|uniref:S8 family serine peptidase n=1 Tax=Haloarcula amylolytica TaxID=396317 RepID=UPI0009B5C442